MSSATIIDYLLDRMKAEEKLSDGALRNLEVKQIPIRLQMLQTGKAATAMLPEPLVSVVEAKGGRVIWDDRGLNEALAVVALKKDRLDDKTVAAFRGAVADAARLIESEPDRFRAVMVKKGLLPAARCAELHDGPLLHVRPRMTVCLPCRAPKTCAAWENGWSERT